MIDQGIPSPSQSKAVWVAAWGAAIGMLVGAFFLPGGDDLYRYYLPFVEGCLDCGYVPYFAQWVLWPLRFLPQYPYTWFAWTIIVVLGLMLLTYRMGANPILFVISFPVLGQIWLGQIDLVICIGMVLFLFAKNPYWRGLGIILALTKPQLMTLPIFFCMLLENPRTLIKLFSIPLVVLSISLLIYGLDWPNRWVTNALSDLPPHVWRLAAMDIWRFGIFLLPVPLILREPKTRFEAGLLVSALATPFFGVYSFVTFLLLDTKWWTAILSYIWLLGYFWFEESAMRFSWILPLSMLIVLVRGAWRKRSSAGVELPLSR